MTIEEFNTMAEPEALAAVLAAAKVPGWAREVVSHRPYASERSLVATALDLAADWTGDDVDEALTDHPRIGERPASSSPTSGHSAREQAAVTVASNDVRGRIAAGNRRYEERFGRIYLVRAKGRSPEEILANLERRLDNAPDVEAVVAAHELREIAALRLAETVTDGDTR
ncbi:2-oxo-4-hydroxy-4-carboxy-5-ureidoimidazoline decarboxylase [Salana multivorans]